MHEDQLGQIESQIGIRSFPWLVVADNSHIVAVIEEGENTVHSCEALLIFAYFICIFRFLIDKRGWDWVRNWNSLQILADLSSASQLLLRRCQYFNDFDGLETFAKSRYREHSLLHCRNFKRRQTWRSFSLYLSFCFAVAGECCIQPSAHVELK